MEEAGKIRSMQQLSDRARAQPEPGGGDGGGQERDRGKGAGEGRVPVSAVGVLAGKACGRGADAARGVGGNVVGGCDGERVGTEDLRAGKAGCEDIGEKGAAALQEDAEREGGGAADELAGDVRRQGTGGGGDGSDGLQAGVGLGCGRGLFQDGVHRDAPSVAWEYW